MLIRLCGAVDVPASGKLIYGLLLENAKGGSVTLSIRRICRALGVSCSAVRANVRRLKEGGYIAILPRYYAAGGRAPNLYKMR